LAFWPLVLGVEESLAGIEAARTRQRASLPSSKVDPVNAAYRGSLERMGLMQWDGREEVEGRTNVGACS
jgi:hypothetical protein